MTNAYYDFILASTPAAKHFDIQVYLDSTSHMLVLTADPSGWETMLYAGIEAGDSLLLEVNGKVCF